MKIVHKKDSHVFNNSFKLRLRTMNHIGLTSDEILLNDGLGSILPPASTTRRGVNAACLNGVGKKFIVASNDVINTILL